MRVRLAVAVIVLAFTAAIFIHQRHTTGARNSRDFSRLNLFPARQHPSWEDPVAVVVALGGVAVAAGIVATGRSRGTERSGRA